MVNNVLEDIGEGKKLSRLVIYNHPDDSGSEQSDDNSRRIFVLASGDAPPSPISIPIGGLSRDVHDDREQDEFNAIDVRDVDSNP